MNPSENPATPAAIIPPPPAQLFKPFDTSPYYSSNTAEAWYIDSQNGNDEADGLSPATAWKTLKRSHSLELGPGQVLRLARGSVWTNESLFFDNGSAGTAGNPVTIEPYGVGDKPTISDPRSLWDSNLGWPGISFGRNTASTKAAAYFVILDLRIQDVQAVAIGLGRETKFITVAGCEVTRSGMGIAIAGEDQKVLGCWVHNGVMAVDSGNPDSDWGANGVGVYGKRIEIAWNYFSDCITPSKSFGTDGGAVEFFGYDSNGGSGWAYVSSDIYIHHNYVRNADCFMEALGKVDRMVIAYNAYVESPNDAFIFHLNSINDDSYFKNVLIANNTLVNLVPDLNGWGVFGLLVNWDKSTVPALTANNSFSIKNNLVQTNHFVLSWINPIGTNLVHDYNHYSFTGPGAFQQNPSVWAQAAHETVGSTAFNNASQQDYRPLAGSPAATASTPISTPLFNTLWNQDLSGMPTANTTDRSRGAWQAISP